LFVEPKFEVITTGFILLTVPQAAHALVIGPDAFGYTASDEGIFSFEDITLTGTRVLAGFDDSTTSATLGFNFDFYGNTYSSVFWSPNGLMTFGSANGQFLGGFVIL